jgi:hypothetical protein
MLGVKFAFSLWLARNYSGAGALSSLHWVGSSAFRRSLGCSVGAVRRFLRATGSTLHRLKIFRVLPDIIRKKRKHPGALVDNPITKLTHLTFVIGAMFGKIPLSPLQI